MQDLYAVLALRTLKGPEGPREKREAEDRFYEQAAQASEPWRWAKATTGFWQNALKRLVQQCDECRNRSTCDQAQPEGKEGCIILSASNGDGAGVFSGRHDERLPERKT